jgi:hypothetical protein
MSGEISIAPIITAKELIFSPIDTIKQANTKAQRVLPFSDAFFCICTARLLSSVSKSKLNHSLICSHQVGSKSALLNSLAGGSGIEGFGSLFLSGSGFRFSGFWLFFIGLNFLWSSKTYFQPTKYA